MKLLLSSCFAFSLLLVGCGQEDFQTDGQSNNQTNDPSNNDSVEDLLPTNDTIPKDACDADFEYFSQNLWTPVFGQCTTCHIEGGLAASSGLSLVALDAQTSFDAVMAYLGQSSHEQLRNKPSANNVSHGGGEIFTSTSIHFQALEGFEAQLLSGDNSLCAVSASSSYLQDIDLLSLNQTLYRASLLLLGRAPTAQEYELVTDVASLKTTIRQLMSQAEFKDFVLESGNDQLLTMKLANNRTAALDELNTWFYYDLYNRQGDLDTEAQDAQNNYQQVLDSNGGNVDAPAVVAANEARNEIQQEAWQTRQAINEAIASEPLELIYYVINNELPYSEILTADYMMANGYSDQTWNGYAQGSTTRSGGSNLDIYDADNWAPSGITSHLYIDPPAEYNGYPVNGEIDPSDLDQGKLPNAGILTSPAFLARYPSTDTNRNRARARWAYYFFLGVDIERLVVRSMDPDELASVSNPGLEGSSCYGCHLVMDPVAGAFQSFGDEGVYLQEDGLHSLPGTYVWDQDVPDGEIGFVEGDRWYSNHIAPGFNGSNINDAGFEFKKIQSSQFVDPIQWVAAQMVEDPRFATGSVKFWYPAIFGQKPMIQPAGENDANFAELTAAYNGQQTFINSWANSFASNQFNLKDLLVDMLTSDLFRASGFSNLNDVRDDEIAQVGFGRLVTPEQLDRKITALFGDYWKNNWSPDTHKLLQDYYLFFGGMDSDQIAERSTELNSLMMQVINRMSNEMACPTAVKEFNQDDDLRFIFNDISPQHVPYIPAQALATSEGLDTSIKENLNVSPAEIKNKLQQLYAYFLGENLSVEHEEIQVLYDLWLAVWEERIGGYTNADNVLVPYSAQVHQNADANFPQFDEFCEVDWDRIVWDEITDWGDINNIKAALGEYYNPEQTIRAWSAVLNYLMTDVRFIYQ